jgi:hypothetical protein
VTAKLKYKSIFGIAIVGVATFVLIEVNLNQPTRSPGVPDIILPEQVRPVAAMTGGREVAATNGAPTFQTALALTNKLFRTVEVAWRETVPEAAFSKFKDSTQRYLANNPVNRQGLVSEGVELAVARRIALKQLIKNDPERALELTMPSMIKTHCHFPDFLGVKKLLIGVISHFLMEIYHSGKGFGNF